MGIYTRSNETASAEPSNPVWKIQFGDRFIFNTGRTEGWRIGSESSLTTGRFYCKSKDILILFTISSMVAAVFMPMDTNMP